MHATGQRQAAALTALTVVLCALLALLTMVPARAEAKVAPPAPRPTPTPTSAPEPSQPPAAVVHDIGVATMRVTTNVDTYTGPGTTYDRAGSLVADSEVQVDGATDDGWYRMVDGRFVNGRFLEAVPEPEALADGDAPNVTMWATETADLRVGPGVKYDRVGSVPGGTEVQVDGRTADNWYRTTEGRFVSGTYLSAWVPVVVGPEHAQQRQLAESEAARLGVVVRWTSLPEGTVGQWKSVAPGTVGIDVVTLGQQTAVLAVRHEAAHQAIYDTCGTPAPPVARDRSENVTDAYADLFLGGMNGFVGPVIDGLQAQVGYGPPTPGDYDAARSVRDGRCS
ncbi:MAG: SH3 domain-containing protein [Micrococcales bacterium]|nr:SH3 domain-containing protein [Micrococcales bacterium]MCL2666359.1 SH3 domain-containing protein [Micrococcales bacterium]